MPENTPRTENTKPQYWLFKTEPDEYSIDDLAAEKDCIWEGIRNYQARNRLRDDVRIGDHVFIYHSSCATPAIVGLATVSKESFADSTQFDPASHYYDAKSPRDKPRWLAVTLRYQRHLARPITLASIKKSGQFGDMELVARPRLSIQAVSLAHANQVLKLAASS